MPPALIHEETLEVGTALRSQRNKMRRPLKEKQKHPALPDHRHGSDKLGRFINYVMHDGKKSVAERVVYDALDTIKKETKKEPLEVFEEAIRNVGPTMEVRSRRVGGANYQVPYEVRPERKQALTFRWILEAARNKKGGAMSKRLAEQLIACSKGEGEAMKKKENMHKMAEANKAFAHFAFTGSRKKAKRA